MPRVIMGKNGRLPIPEEVQFHHTLISLNKKDFLVFPGLKDKVFTPEEFEKYTKMMDDKAKKSPFDDPIGVLSKEEGDELKKNIEETRKRMDREIEGKTKW